MARKRYETAFIPSTTTQLPSSSQYPDVDSLLLSIDCITLGPGDMERRRRSSGRRGGATGHHRWRSRSMTPQEPATTDSISRTSTNTTGPSISSASAAAPANAPAIRHPRAPSIDSVSWSSDKEQQGSTQNIRTYFLNSSLKTIAPRDQSRKQSRNFENFEKFENLETVDFDGGQKSKVTSAPLSLSEPLRPKHFLLKSYVSIQSSSGCSTNTSSPVPAELQLRHKGHQRSIMSGLKPKRSGQANLVKVTSTSSLESIDSGRSEDSKILDKQSQTVQLPPNSKLLSPISDKSPIESTTMTSAEKERSEVTEELRGEVKSLLATAEQLTNLPWEMPKLKRKLALLVDSGISLDTGSSSREAECYSWSDLKGHTGQFCENPQFEGRRTTLGLEFPAKDESQVTATTQGILATTNELMDPLPLTEAPPPPPPEASQPVTLSKPDRFKMKLDFGERSRAAECDLVKVNVHLEKQDWFHGAITRIEAEEILRLRKAGSFLVRNCESSVFNRYSLSLKSSRGFIHVRIESKLDSGKFLLGAEAEEFDCVPSLVLHFMSHRLPIKGAEHVLLKYPVITNLL